jgi:ElaB/YqjD/DUF883 family membrane-anchored ribosome-binding protein
MEQRPGGGTVGTKNNNGNISAKAREMGDVASRELEDLRERFGDVNERVVGFIRERPGTSILIAIGAGFLIGRLLRS